LKDVVSLIKLKNNGENVKEDIRKALSLLGYKMPSSVNTITLKVNLCYYWNSSTGYTTDPVFVGSLIDYLREEYGDDVEIKIAEADASAMQTKYAFPLLGYSRLASQKGVTLFNLCEDTLEEKETEVNGHELSFLVPQTLLNSDLFINLPKLKVMRHTHITCAMKNLFGAMGFPRKVKYHPVLAEAIVGMNKFLKPHLNIVDGIVALGTVPVRLNLVMAGVSTFAVDWVAAQVMGYNPAGIKFLKLAIEERFGDPKDVHVVGERIDEFRCDFPTENTVLARAKMRLQISILRAYSKISGDIIPPGIVD
jgi:uncharacterized protein (DUF362 family)